jgi:hypothetical protein
VWPSERGDEDSLKEVMQKQQQSPRKPERQPSKTLSEEQERLVADIKRHHPKATTEGILKHLEEWGVE